MKSSTIILSVLTLSMLIFSCEKDITIELPSPEDAIVVEGHIENGQFPYVLLTRNIGFFEAFDLEELEDLFVFNADVTIFDGIQTIKLIEVPFPAGGIKGSIYVGTSMKGEVGKTYYLTVKADGKTLTAKTSIPNLAPLDSLGFDLHTHPEDDDTLIQLRAFYSDPDTAGNYIRYFTQRNNEPVYPGMFSVFDDNFINGKSFDFPLDRAQARTEGFGSTYGLFNHGDTITVTWNAIDKAHFDFWETWEQTVNSNGNPFGTPTTILTNIEGGLGIWGGYGVTTITLIIPPQ